MFLVIHKYRLNLCLLEDKFVDSNPTSKTSLYSLIWVYLHNPETVSTGGEFDYIRSKYNNGNPKLAFDY